jgi:hypothetical protein
MMADDVCKSCERSVSEMLTLKGKAITLNAEGVCPICVEVLAEVAADDAEMVRVLLARRRRLSPALLEKLRAGLR